jgi:DNA-binding XRE family transcriptional regulator/mannose-6-phosphate isomerase-like protein (cupin superfamily)
MAPATGSALTSIADCLRATREQQGLTLEQAAGLSGISKSHLSRLESGERQPSVASLLALSTAFRVPVGAFFGETQGAAPVTICLSDDPRRESNGLTIAPCSGYAGSSVIDALRVTVAADRPAPALTRHPGEEWIYVLSGRLRLEYDGEDYFLDAGTAAHFNAELPHRLGAETTTTELLLVAARPVRNLHQIH